MLAFSSHNAALITLYTTQRDSFLRHSVFTGWNPRPPLSGFYPAVAAISALLIFISSNTIFSSPDIQTENQTDPQVQTVKPDSENIRASIVKSALSLVGTPYKYGGNSRHGFDCCGFVMYVYGLNRIHLPRTSREQFAAGKKIEMKDIRKGDLLFYKVRNDTISHVGIYIGDRYFVHSPVPGTRVRSERIDLEYWTAHFAGAATYLD